jgi:lysophospholipase L1-like esterase
MVISVVTGLLLLAWLLSSVLSHGNVTISVTNPQRRKKVVIFGDSITQIGYRPGGWVSLLSYYWSRRADVINRGYSGYTSRMALQIVTEAVISESPDLVLIFYGANDAVSENYTLQYVSLDNYESNLIAIVTKLRQVRYETQYLIISPIISVCRHFRV